MTRIVVGIVLISVFFFALSEQKEGCVAHYLPPGIILLLLPGALLAYFGFRSRKRNRSATPASRAPTARNRGAGPRDSDRDMLEILVSLCEAYAEDNVERIARLEPKATRIGEALNRRGGIEEMRRVYALIRPQRGLRTLDMHWNGIGDWRG
jgi:hypothetical protein